MGKKFFTHKFRSLLQKLVCNKRKSIIVGSVFVILFICLCVSDDWQQKRMATLRSGYHHMMEEEYKEAVVDFENYLNVQSEIYWRLMELVNNEFYSREGVRDAITLCKERNNL